MNAQIKPNKKLFPVVFIIALPVCYLLYYLVINFKNDDNIGIYYYLNLIGFFVLFAYAIIFTIIIFINAVKFLFDKNAGLFITDFGIDNNLGIIGSGKIEWNEVADLYILKSRKQKPKIVIIKINDNDKYLANKNFIQKYFLKGYIRRYGSPVIIPKNTIDCKLDELISLISKQLRN